MFNATNAMSKTVILSCYFNEYPERKMNFHIDPIKEHLLQFDTSKYPRPQLALTDDSRFLLGIEIILSSSQIAEAKNKFKDNYNYNYRMIFFNINRYSGRLEMHTQTMDKINFKLYMNNLKKIKGSNNMYLELVNFARKNDGPGYRLNEDFGAGTCNKAKQQF